MFEKYQHVERFNTTETEGIEIGTCYIFPKIDGTNASVWYDGTIKAGSRTRELTLEQDNAGFYAWVLQQENLANFLLEYPFFRLFGEWLVPHTLKTYRDDCWRKFYVFDVMNEKNEYVHFEYYKPMLEAYGIEYIPPISIIRNPSFDNLLNYLNTNTYLIKDGQGAGEGVVIKNYEYRNKYGRQTWAKIVRNEFKDEHKKVMSPNEVNGTKFVEEEIVDTFCTSALVDKVHSKILTENDGWQSKFIPQLLHTVYYDLVREETWNAIKKFKYPKVDFKVLQRFTNCKIKELKPELF